MQPLHYSDLYVLFSTLCWKNIDFQPVDSFQDSLHLLTNVL